MSKLYSPSTRGFYCPSIHGANVPADAVPISEGEWQGLLQAQSRGLVIIADGPVGMPIAVEATEERQ